MLIQSLKSKQAKDFVPWTERVLTDHDQAVNRISNVINSMVSQGMRAEDIANHFYPGNAQSMRADNIPKIIRDATVKAKRTARTEANREGKMRSLSRRSR